MKIQSILVEKVIMNEVREAQKQGRIPTEIYEKYATPHNPLPKEFYPDYKEASLA